MCHHMTLLLQCTTAAGCPCGMGGGAGGPRLCVTCPQVHLARCSKCTCRQPQPGQFLIYSAIAAAPRCSTSICASATVLLVFDRLHFLLSWTTSPMWLMHALPSTRCLPAPQSLPTWRMNAVVGSRLNLAGLSTMFLTAASKATSCSCTSLKDALSCWEQLLADTFPLNSCACRPVIWCISDEIRSLIVLYGSSAACMAICCVHSSCSEKYCQ